MTLLKYNHSDGREILIKEGEIMMKNRTKKILGMSLAMVMTASAFTGCGQDSPAVSTETNKVETDATVATTETTVADEKMFDGVELKALFNGVDGTSIAPRMEAINEILSEKLGVTISEYEFLTDATYELVVGADEELDFVFAANWLRYDKNAMDNMYAEITDEDLQKYAPYIWANCQEDTTLTAPKIEGKRYAIGSLLANAHPLWAYRGDLADKYGIGTIENADDLEKYLYALAENEPEMIPMDVKGDEYYLVASLFYPEQGWVAPGSTSYGSAININFLDGEYKVELTAETPEYLEHVTRMNEWYKAGIFSKSILSSSTSMTESFKAGRSGVCRLSKPAKAQELWDELQADDRKDWNIRYFANYPTYELRKGCMNQMASISGYSDNVEATLAVINEIYSNEELFMLFYYGLEGINYEIVDGVLKTLGDPETLGNIACGVVNYDFVKSGDTYTFDNADALIEQMEAAGVEFVVNSMTLSYEAVTQQKVAIDEVFGQHTKANQVGAFEGTPEDAVAAEVAAYKAVAVDEYIAELQRQIDEFVGSVE